MATFEKAKIRTEKEKAKKNKKKWWIIKTKNYQFHFLLLPIVIFIIPYGKIKNHFYKSMEWNEEKATKVLDKKLPKMLKYDDETNSYYIYVQKFGFTFINSRNAWIKKFNYKLRDFFISNYENENYIKTVEEDYDWYYIMFTEKN